jgi:hypothetical protein
VDECWLLACVTHSAAAAAAAAAAVGMTHDREHLPQVATSLPHTLLPHTRQMLHALLPNEQWQIPNRQISIDKKEAHGVSLVLVRVFSLAVFSLVSSNLWWSAMSLRNTASSWVEWSFTGTGGRGTLHKADVHTTGM